MAPRNEEEEKLIEKYLINLDYLNICLERMTERMDVCAEKAMQRRNSGYAFKEPLTAMESGNNFLRDAWTTHHKIGPQFDAIRVDQKRMSKVRELRKKRDGLLEKYRNRLRLHVTFIGRIVKEAGEDQNEEKKEEKIEETIEEKKDEEEDKENRVPPRIEKKDGEDMKKIKKEIEAEKYKEAKRMEEQEKERKKKEREKKLLNEMTRKVESKFLEIDFLCDPSELPFEWNEEECMDLLLLSSFNHSHRQVRRINEGVKIEPLSKIDNCIWREKKSNKKKGGRPPAAKKAKIDEMKIIMEKKDDCLELQQKTIATLTELKERLAEVNREFGDLSADGKNARVNGMSDIIKDLPSRVKTINDAIKKLDKERGDEKCEHCFDTLKKGFATMDFHLERVKKMIEKLHEERGKDVQGLKRVDTITYTKKKGFVTSSFFMARKLEVHDKQVLDNYSKCLDDLHYKLHYMIYLMNMAKKLGDRRERGSDGYNYPLEPIIRTNEAARRLWEKAKLLSSQYDLNSSQLSLAGQNNIRKLQKEQVEDLNQYRAKLREHVIDVGRRCYDRTKEFGPVETIIIEAKNGNVKFAERKVTEDPGEEKRNEESLFLNIDCLGDDPSEGLFKWNDEEWMEYLLLGSFNMERRRERRQKEGVEIEALSAEDDNCKWIEMKEAEEKRKKEEEKKKKEEERRKKKRGRPLKKPKGDEIAEIDENNNAVEDPMGRLNECNNCIKYLQMEIDIIKETKDELLMLNNEAKKSVGVRLPDRIQEMNLMLNQIPLRAESIFKRFTDLRSDQCDHCLAQMKKKLMIIDFHLERVKKMIEKLYNDYGTDMKGLMDIDSITFSLENGFKVKVV